MCRAADGSLGRNISRGGLGQKFSPGIFCPDQPSTSSVDTTKKSANLDREFERKSTQPKQHATLPVLRSCKVQVMTLLILSSFDHDPISQH